MTQQFETPPTTTWSPLYMELHPKFSPGKLPWWLRNLKTSRHPPSPNADRHPRRISNSRRKKDKKKNLFFFSAEINMGTVQQLWIPEWTPKREVDRGHGKLRHAVQASGSPTIISKSRNVKNEDSRNAEIIVSVEMITSSFCCFSLSTDSNWIHQGTYTRPSMMIPFNTDRHVAGHQPNPACCLFLNKLGAKSDFVFKRLKRTVTCEGYVKFKFQFL